MALNTSTEPFSENHTKIAIHFPVRFGFEKISDEYARHVKSVLEEERKRIVDRIDRFFAVEESFQYANQIFDASDLQEIPQFMVEPVDFSAIRFTAIRGVVTLFSETYESPRRSSL